jgi:hypothetical protein
VRVGLPQAPRQVGKGRKGVPRVVAEHPPQVPLGLMAAVRRELRAPGRVPVAQGGREPAGQAVRLP